MKNTDTKERILELLFLFPNRTFHLREIARSINISPPAIAKAIKELEGEELILSKRKFLFEIQANLSNKAFRNLKRVHNLGSIYSSGLFDFLHENFPLNNIVLFGSYSKGDDAENSDIDIAIDAKEKKIDLEKYEKKLGRRINIEFIEINKLLRELRDSIINGIVLLGHISLK